MNIFAANLKAARTRRGHSQSSFALASKFPQSHISDFETGRRTPTLKNLYRLRDALGAVWEELLGKTK
jgi:transcriptional regulator with XRE-family HTH domain